MIYSSCNYTVTLKLRLRVTQGHRNRTNRFTTYNFLLMFHGNHVPISYRFRDIRRFQLKIAKISHPFCFSSPLKGFPLELGTGAGSQKTRMMVLPDRQRSLTISSAVWVECTNVTDRRTDGQKDGRTPGHSKDRAYA